jgi:hypothetical protein
MTHHPRYEPVKGSPDSAYRGYHGARLVSLVLGIVDRWRGKSAVKQSTSALGARHASLASATLPAHRR